MSKPNVKETISRVNIAKKLLEVMKVCAYIQKDDENTFHHYKYASAGNVMGKVNEALVANNLVTIYHDPEILNIAGDMITVRVNIDIIDIDSGESVTIQGLGSGKDGGDKGVAKAQTQAIKYAWMHSLTISTGEDPEADASTDRAVAKGGNGNSTENDRLLEGEIRLYVKEKEIPFETIMNMMQLHYSKDALKSLSYPEKQNLLTRIKGMTEPEAEPKCH